MEGLKVGGHVIFVDPVGRQHDALVTAVWSETCINVVYVSGDESKSDTYGRQIERTTSLSAQSVMGRVHGMYFMMPGDAPTPIALPLEQ